MKLFDLTEQYKNQLADKQNAYSCLAFALQIPSICSRVEFLPTWKNTGRCEDGALFRANGKPWDGNMYKAWVQEHNYYINSIYYGSMTLAAFYDNLYDLRNQITHEGVWVSGNNKFNFIDSGMAMSVGDVVFLPITSLCEALFDAACDVLNKLNLDIDISPFDDLMISQDIYTKITNDAVALSRSFWNKYSKEDKKLNAIYDHIMLDNKLVRACLADIFTKDSDAVFEVWDFDRKYGYIIDDDEMFIHKDYDEEKSEVCRRTKKETYVLRLNKDQYERMIQVADAVKEFWGKNAVDINIYKKE